MNNKGLGWLTGLFLLLYMTMLVVTSFRFFTHSPPASVHGTVEIVAVFSMVLAILGSRAGKGLPYLGSALIALFLACLLPSWLWLRGVCGNHLVVPTLVVMLPLWAAQILRPARWSRTRASRV